MNQKQLLKETQPQQQQQFWEEIRKEADQGRQQYFNQFERLPSYPSQLAKQQQPYNYSNLAIAAVTQTLSQELFPVLGQYRNSQL